VFSDITFVRSFSLSIMLAPICPFTPYEIFSKSLEMFSAQGALTAALFVVIVIAEDGVD